MTALGDLQSGSHLSGQDLSPSPHESSLTVLWRLSWRNALASAQVARLCNIGGRFSNFSFFRESWINTTYFFERTSWRLPTEAENAIRENLDGLESIWFDSTLRVCPICLEHGYHSVWFQFRQLPICPLHQCELRSECLTCGAPLGAYKFSAELLMQPYRCSHCRQHVSGVPLNLNLHLDFRHNPNVLSQVFSPLWTWLIEAKRALRPMVELKRSNAAWEVAWTQWCRPREFLVSVGCLLHPLPNYCSTPPYRRISILRWHAAAYETHSQIGGASLRARIYQEQVNVYKDVLGRICFWLHSIGAQVEIAERVHTPDKTARPRLLENGSFALALKLFREKFEHGDQELMRAIESPELVDGPTAYLPWVYGRPPTAALHAFYVGIFANLVHVVEKAKSRGGEGLASIDLRDQAIAAQAWWQEERTCVGMIFFPEICMDYHSDCG